MPSFDVEGTSSKLHWEEFEAFAERAFTNFGFETTRNHRFLKPRMEIDLFARKDRFAFAVDCKHWKRTVGFRTMLEVGERQIMRSQRLLESPSVDRVVPLVLTLHDEMLHILENGVAIVPIQKLSDFIMNWESSREKILVIERRGEYQSQLTNAFLRGSASNK